MMKKGLLLFAALASFWTAGAVCQADIIAPYGEGQIGLTSVVLCDSLTVRSDASASSSSVQTLRYGTQVIVMTQQNGWAKIAVSDDVDAEPPGWVNASFLAIDPAWYKTTDSTTVYAWNDTGAKKVAQLGADTVLPILKDQGDWVVVSLRGAAGWIRKTSADYSQKKQSSSSQSSSEQKKKSSQDDSSDDSSDDSGNDYFTVYAADGSTSEIRFVAGATYEDYRGRTYIKQDANTYYCITTDKTYANYPGHFQGDGEGAGEEDNWADYSSDNSSDYSDYDDERGDGEGAGLEDNWANVGDGEGAGLEDNWADYEN